MTNYFVTAIGTDSGKTIVSAILTEALQADYWKPIQAGYPRDTDTVEQLVSNPKTKFHSEKYLLHTAASPHAAAKIDNVIIDLNTIKLPETQNTLVIEGAGGLMVPLNDEDLIVDLISKLNVQVIVVCNLYLGSINHTLLTFELLKKKEINVKGIIFNGPENADSESIILGKTDYKLLMTIRPMKEINPGTISNLAHKLRLNLDE